MTALTIPRSRLARLETVTLEAGKHAPNGVMCVMPEPSAADIARFDSKLRPCKNGCIEWTGSTMWKGYGRFFYAGKNVRAHRFAYWLEADIPEGLVLDHKCRNRLCVNPDHLEPVTPRENVLRSPIAPAHLNALKTHCPKGHPYSGDNLFVRRSSGIRECRECGRAESRNYQRRRRAAERAAR